MEKITELEEAIGKKSLVGIYSVFYTIAHGDPNFSTHKFRDVLEYVKSKNIEGLMQEYDGEEFEQEDKWDEDYWALVASSLLDNFCDERIDHLEAVGKKVYPVRNIETPRTVSEAEQVRKPASETDESESSVVEESDQGILTKEQKWRVKFDHAKRTSKDIGGFFDDLFRRGPGR